MTDLSPRQREIVRLLLEGKSQNEIALVTYTSLNNVHQMIHKIRQKYRVVTMMQLGYVLGRLERDE